MTDPLATTSGIEFDPPDELPRIDLVVREGIGDAGAPVHVVRGEPAAAPERPAVPDGHTAVAAVAIPGAAEVDEVAAAHRAAWERHEAETQVVADEVQRRGHAFGAAWGQAFRAAAEATGATTEIQWGEPAPRSRDAVSPRGGTIGA